MDLSTTAWVTDPGTQVTSWMNGDIPSLGISRRLRRELVILVDPNCLTPIQQVDFLRALAEEASELATRVAALHAEPVGVKG